MSEVETELNSDWRNMRLPILRDINGDAHVDRNRSCKLQDVEADLEIEIDTFIEAVLDLPRVGSNDTPAIDGTYETIQIVTQMLHDDLSKNFLQPVDD